jgi:hypothetical protein
MMVSPESHWPPRNGGLSTWIAVCGGLMSVFDAAVLSLAGCFGLLEWFHLFEYIGTHILVYASRLLYVRGASKSA